MTNIPLSAAFIYGEFNPSGLYGDITVEQLKTDSYSASTRNRLIAEAFYLTKDIAKYGSGFIRIRQAIADYPTMKYEFRNEGNGFSQMAERLGVSRITVQRLLSLLQQQGRALRIGARKNGYWQISEKKLDG